MTADPPTTTDDDLCREALASGNVVEADFREAESLFGLAGVLELLTVCGCYSTLAMYAHGAKTVFSDHSNGVLSGPQ